MILPTKKEMLSLAKKRCWHRSVPQEQRSISYQIEAANLTDRVNVIHFASLFSGTGIAPPRSVPAHLKLAF